MPTDDNEHPSRMATTPMPDAHGHAALLLVESLIHGLIERSTITVSEAINIVESADSVQVDVSEAADGHSAPMWRSHALLSAIVRSLSHERERSRLPPARGDDLTGPGSSAELPISSK